MNSFPNVAGFTVVRVNAVSLLFCPVREKSYRCMRTSGAALSGDDLTITGVGAASPAGTSEQDADSSGNRAATNAIVDLLPRGLTGRED